MADDFDAPRRLLEQLMTERDTNAKHLSEKVLGHNHAYINQYLNKNTPRELGEADREKLGRYFGVDPDRFRARPRGAGISGIVVTTAPIVSLLNPARYDLAKKMAEAAFGPAPIEHREMLVADCTSMLYDELIDEEAQLGRPLTEAEGLAKVDVWFRRWALRRIGR